MTLSNKSRCHCLYISTQSLEGSFERSDDAPRNSVSSKNYFQQSRNARPACDGRPVSSKHLERIKVLCCLVARAQRKAAEIQLRRYCTLYNSLPLLRVFVVQSNPCLVQQYSFSLLPRLPNNFRLLVLFFPRSKECSTI